jgi:S1-C subfamily serine protease
MAVRALLLLAVILCAAPTAVNGQAKRKQQPKKASTLKPLAPQEIARRTTAALVSITTPLGYGSGFCIGRDPLIPHNALIATNYHVLKGCESASIRSVPFKDSESPDGQYIRFVDEFHDIALLSTEIKRSPLPVAPSLPTVGDTVYVMGNPEQLEGSFSAGLVSAVRSDPSPWIQITAPISHGSSGGPVLNTFGEVIGIATAIFSGGQNINRAVPSTLINAAIAAMNADPERTTDQAVDAMDRDRVPNQSAARPQSHATRDNSQNSDQNWLFITRGPRGSYYGFHRLEATQDGSRRIWIAEVVDDHPQNITKFLEDYDCQNRFWRVIRTEYFLDGKFIDRQEHADAKWIGIAPGTPAQRFLEFVCK